MLGYAKPVPVNFRALSDPRRDMIRVAAAGPVTNIALALSPHSLDPTHAGCANRVDVNIVWRFIAQSTDAIIDAILRLTGN
jgi:Zn-dependent protease